MLTGGRIQNAGHAVELAQIDRQYSRSRYCLSGRHDDSPKDFGGWSPDFTRQALHSFRCCGRARVASIVFLSPGGYQRVALPATERHALSLAEYYNVYRVWDWIVGLTMIAIAIVAGGIVAGMIAIPITMGFGYLIHFEGRTGGLVFLSSAIGMFVILQSAGFYDFYRRRRAVYATGRAGFFYLIPRAIQRMRTGYELAGFIDKSTGKPTTVQAPVNAARRGVVAVLLIFASVAAAVFGATAKGEWTLVVTGLGLIGTIVGLALLAQVVLAYAGFIRRQT